ncbi:MAG: hypothetical protein ACKOWW_04035 [Flavobacteriales bacterium]
MTNGSLNNFHFKFWLPFFAILLLLIPILIWQNFVLPAKLSGITLLIGLLIALKQWFAVARQINDRKERYVMNTNERYYIESLLPKFKTWSKSDQTILIDQLGIALSELKFSGESTLEDKISVILQLVLATWGEGYLYKQDWVLAFEPNDKICKLYIKEHFIADLNTSFGNLHFAPSTATSDSVLLELKEKMKNL